MPDNKKGVKGKKSIFKRFLSKFIINTVNRFSFVGFVKKIALSDKNQSVYKLLQQVPEDWQHTEKIKEIAVEQTIAQFEKKGENVNSYEIQNLINDMAIQYDREIHINAATSIDVIFSHIFDYPEKQSPFTSPDNRELKHLDKLKQLKKKGHGVVYLINHSSHLDEFIFSLFCQRHNMGLPVFAAGQNMMTIKSIARLLMVGSYVVLRQGASKYQMAALYHYCSALSKTGSQQGIFLEAWRGGARTRDGSLRYPKKLVTLKGAIDVDDDVIIQPVALSYSAVPEDLMMCSRKSVASWIRGMGFLKTILKFPFYPKTFLWKSMENIYGRAFITMPEPVLLSDLKTQHSNDKSGISIDEFVALFSIKEIAKHKKIMSSQLVARGLTHAKKTKTHKLNDGINSQLDEINEYHQNTFNQKADIEDFITGNSTYDIVKDGLKTLKKR
ncbi:MAG: 1-acyl-sn-glycerol-3-phosphate acyltransferase, partial [Desulfobacteraceae bacterium]|nr:1-acyl-sn-glycerol-3-phosphate acyltransferase [Desulfobacteraceae bacterium]